MSKIFSFYENLENDNGIERVWYDSSNVVYSECIDKPNELKTLTVVFSNGTRYEYKDVNVSDYLLFREDVSQGKALNRIIKGKKYEYGKLENADLKEIEDDLDLRRNGGFYLINGSDFFEIKDSVNKSVYKNSKQLDDSTFNMVKDILKSVGIITK